MNSIPVLVVGAGPTGLMMAAELARYGIPCRIIDKKAEPTGTTNAAGIQARTMEIFEHLGLSDKFLSQGLAVPVLHIESEGKLLANVFLNRMESHFNFILMLPQSHTEKILTEHLQKFHVYIERSVELLDFEQKNNKVISTLKQANGSIETLESDWIIGCDGYHSTVREKANIALLGDELDEEFFVADLRVSPLLTADAVMLYFAKGAVLGLFPLANNVYRAVANTSRREKGKAFSEKEIKSLIYTRSHGKCEVHDVLWSSSFWIHNKVAGALKQGSVFIAGDAAHVHSPAGAQGMNTGIHDAYNLAWKLALVIRQSANPTLLESYQAERYPIIKMVVKRTKFPARFALTTNPLIRRLRNFIFKYIVGKSTFLQKKLATQISQLSWNYKESPIVEKNTKRRLKCPQPGTRIPDVILRNNARLYDYFHNNQHNLLLFTGFNPQTQDVQLITKVSAWVSDHVGDWMKPYIISQQTMNLPNVIADDDLAIHRRYHVMKPSMCLIRPDHYIALFQDGINEKLITTFLRRIGLPVRDA
jgi:2-polyprenyl-6-methoxyphenol hydroxylase-like FAD-dependent oxidoreductase